jgi:transmembrane sensor
MEIPDFVFAFFEDPSSLEKADAVRLWLKADAKNKQIFDAERKLWYASKLSQTDDGESTEMAWQKLKSNLNIEPQPTKIRIIPFLKQVAKVAAIVLLTFSISTLITHWYLGRKTKTEKLTYSEFTVPYGSKSDIYLPDGSRVWLNAGSKLKYSSQFNTSNRTLSLEGEGYFQVAPNAALPFIVNTKLFAVAAIGTEFNIKAYPDDKEQFTTVIKGKVELCQTNNPVKKVAIAARDQVLITRPLLEIQMIENQDKPVSTKSELIGNEDEPVLLSEESEVPIEIISSWKGNRWIIERTPLGGLARELERRYDIEIVFLSENVKKMVFSGKIENETLEQFLQILKLTAPIDYKIEKKKVFLSEKLLFGQKLRVK